MKKKILIGLILGLGLGLSQLLIPYTTTSSIPVGSDIVDGRRYFRGFPLQSEAIGVSPMPNPPITSKTFINILIFIVFGICLTLVISPLLSVLTKNKRRRIFTLTGFIIGLTLGIGQLYYFSSREVTFPPINLDKEVVCTQGDTNPDCTRICLDENRQGNLCTVPSSRMDTRGWPYKHDTYKQGWNIYEVGPLLIVNTLIFILGTPLILGSIAVATESTKEHKSATKTSRK